MPREKDEPEFFEPPDWKAKRLRELHQMWDEIEGDDPYAQACWDAGIDPYGEL